MSEGERVRLMLVDDHEVVRAGLRTLLSASGLVDIVGEAGSVAEAVALALELRPNVVLMDLRLSDGSGVEACREILSESPEVRVLFLTSYSDAEAVTSTGLAGASGYVLKDIGHLALLRAILDTAEGRRVLDAKIAASGARGGMQASHQEKGEAKRRKGPSSPAREPCRRGLVPFPAKMGKGAPPPQTQGEEIFPAPGP